ncbi:ribonuclease E/G [Hespellia stercorisuis]|uniref:Ribonuclease G n=1 Tax=Hespellia stercorisuis DSM 15480 TaxID=1121950 RepID=A0A1M6N169_9FIRM|nr:ribonuclease E/G [Hespellia stercorisuis]SHJ89450.1 ribonuclease G [Hespellia stercorisuis DSM 15480]
MERRVIITKLNKQILTSIMEDGEIVEIHCSDDPVESKGSRHILGNVYIGRVRNIVANIGAAFIEIEPGIECYYALDKNPQPFFTRKIGKKPLCIGDEMLVQISKEAVKTKAPTVTSAVSLTGRYVVLSMGNPKIGVSGKIGREKRAELIALMEPCRNEEYGFVVRTNAKDAPHEEIVCEAERLIKVYRHLRETAGMRTCFSCLYQAPEAYLTDLKNLYQEGLKEYVVEDTALHSQIAEYLGQEQPENLEKLRLYQDRQLPLHKLYSIDTVLGRALREKVWLKTGGYLIIQPTEALTVIDVNSGKSISGRKAQDAYRKINLEAAAEAAKQMRLRNLSGIILIDFINLEEKEAMNELLNTLRKYLIKDPVQATLVDVTKLQLVEVTRKKVRKPLHESVKNNFTNMKESDIIS